ncbi:MAG TPA: barstar family protein [Chitinophagaceae bacterium]|jgi:RNAse (barnase) inhibitor barstar|nr:barstar family protein [Chitinophagaceae bacterium]
MKIINIDCNEISDWDSFHKYFKKLFGFPDFYGPNMNAWIDCLTYLDEEDGMSKIKIEESTTLTLQLENAESFKKRCPEIFEALIECSAFVNYRRIEMGDDPVLLLSFHV